MSTTFRQLSDNFQSIVGKLTRRRKMFPRIFPSVISDYATIE